MSANDESLIESRRGGAERGVRAVVFDLGGVVLGSPLHAIARLEQRLGIPEGFVNRHVAASAPDGAWHRLERGELAAGPEFFELFDQELAAAGQLLSSAEMFAEIHREAEPRPAMLEAIRRLRAAGLAVAALTNNWASEPGEAGLEERSGGRDELKRNFDHFVESSVLGMRKPDPRIYQHVCELLDVEPTEVVFLDDIGANLKSARALGMTTIKVVDPEDALRELEGVVGFPLARRLSSAQRRYLRGLAHDRDPVVELGRAGLTSSLRNEIDRALDHHELIKVRVRADRQERRDLVRQIEQSLGCEAVGLVGHVAMLYREPRADADKSGKGPKIRLPRRGQPGAR